MPMNAIIEHVGFFNNISGSCFGNSWFEFCPVLATAMLFFFFSSSDLCKGSIIN
jgi:hypothetical protein